MILSFIIIFIIVFIGIIVDSWGYEFDFSTIVLIIGIAFIMAWIIMSVWAGSPILFNIFIEAFNDYSK